MNHAVDLQLPRHFDHRSAEAETGKETLRHFIVLGGPKHHARSAPLA
jgi:hypothetical protein